MRDEDKENHQKEIEKFQAQNRSLQDQIKDLELKALQVAQLEQQIEKLNQEMVTLRSQKSKDQESADAKAKAEEILKETEKQMQITANYQAMHLQNEILKYRMRVKDLEAAQESQEKEFRTKFDQYKE